MTPAAARAELATLLERRGPLEASRADLAVAITRELASDAYDRRHLRDLRANQADIVAQIREIDDRRDALEKALPSAATVDQAGVDVAALLLTFERTETDFTTTATAFRKALVAAEQIARRLVVIKAAATQTLIAAGEVASAAGLALDRREPPALAPADAYELLLVAVLLQQVAEHVEIDEAVLRDLNGVRAEVAA